MVDIVIKNLDVTKIHLKNHHIEPTQDLRDTSTGSQPVDDNYDQIITELMETGVLVHPSTTACQA